MSRTVILVCILSIFGVVQVGESQQIRKPEQIRKSEQVGDWKPYAPRDEIRPDFSLDRSGGRDQQSALVISAGRRAAIDGAWIATLPVQGGKHYRFSAWRRTSDVASPRRSGVVKITWQDEHGKLVEGVNGPARPEYPLDRSEKDGWTEVADTYLVPKLATQAKVELHLRWTSGSVKWSDVRLAPADRPLGRRVRLATIHFRPKEGKTAKQKRESFAPLIEQAARLKADLVCLPESLTYYASGRPLAEVAETIPGPTSDYFVELSKKHNLYVVAGLTERDGSVVYNTSVLTGPEGLIGKYRKVCLPREEIEAGVTPGDRYPVFDTRFGKVGMMICWDVHFPEVARHLGNNGAEVIAMPIWGGNPTLAKARAIENQLFLVTSTYTDPSRDWMKSAIFDQEGEMLAVGGEWGSVEVAEVDLEQRKHWDWLGDFKARIHRERPPAGFRN